MIGIGGTREVSLAIRAPIVGEGDRLIRHAAQGIGDRGRAIQRVIGIRRDRAARIGGSPQIPARIVRIRRGPGIRTHLLFQVSQTAVRVSGGKTPGIGHGGEVVVRVVGELSDSAARIGHLLQAIQFVVLICRRAAQGCGNTRLIAIAVVGVGRSDPRGACGIDVLVELVQRIDDPRVGAMQDVAGVVGTLHRPIAHRIQGIADLVRRPVDDLREAVCVVVRVLDVARIRLRHPLE